ncbi:tetratricopeptide repeat protein [Actinoplanes nipponensis]|uniref:tetratricopeptide repeat protein n=1 Tax=Actinoplanes nipponensis TaxID=135950 RepID=UPI001941C536|nr:tetratricopeptide repeat protein [Actinoplanes nipponensis]
MSSEPTSQSEPETTPEEYRQRALLMADLGRYDEAVGEIALGLAVAPADPGLLSTLARVHVAAAQPAEALAAAEQAVAAAPHTVGPLVVRAMALSDDRRFGEAAGVAASILAAWPSDPYAQRTGAALLSEARNGQDALNAAWHGVRLAPADAEAHLVLAVVAARLRLFDLAQRAYGEALDLDPGIGDAQRDVGVVRLERRRWALALESLADAAMPVPDPVAAETPTAAPPPITPPAGPVLDRTAGFVETFRQAVLYAGNGVLIAAVLAAVMTMASSGVARMWGGVIGVVILVALGAWLARALPVPVGSALREIRGSGRVVAAVYAMAVAPLGLVGFAVFGGVGPLIVAMVLAAFAELAVLMRRA